MKFYIIRDRISWNVLFGETVPIEHWQKIGLSFDSIIDAHDWVQNVERKFITNLDKYHIFCE